MKSAFTVGYFGGIILTGIDGRSEKSCAFSGLDFPPLLATIHGIYALHVQQLCLVLLLHSVLLQGDIHHHIHGNSVQYGMLP